MTRYFLSRIKIEGFRGINNELEPLELCFQENAVNSIFAVNGVGKSSIFEALNYAIRKSVPKLDELLTQEKPSDYFCNRFHSKRLASIELELKPDDGKSKPVTILVQRDKDGTRTVTSPTGYADPEGLLSDLDEDFTLLDYRTFTRFIDTTPLDRGRSFSALLGLSSYSDFRQSLQTVSDTRALNTDLDISSLRIQVIGLEERAQTALRRLKTSFEGLTGKPLADATQIDQWTEDALSALGHIELIKSHVEKKDFDSINFAAIKDSIKTAEVGIKRKDLEKAIETITELDALGNIESVAISAEHTVIRQLAEKKTELLNATRGNTFRTLYDTVRTLIDNGEWTEQNKCPLCESAIADTLSALISKQLEQYGLVSENADEVKLTWDKAKWVRRLQTLERTKPLGIADDAKVSNSLSQKASSGDLASSDVDDAIVRFEQLEGERSIKLIAAIAQKEALEKELPASLVSLTEQVEYARQFSEARAEYFSLSRQQHTAKSKLAIRERWQQFIVKAGTVYATAEADLSRQKIKEIDGEYKSRFSRITGINDVVPELQRTDRREDLHVQLSDFHGQSGVSARALLSESYRNALAISVFLSAALKHSGVPRFVVLDDVTSSFDSGHQWKLMEEIRLKLQQPNNESGLQFIILSHDGLLEKYFDKLGNTSDWNHQKLQGWPPMGAVMSHTQDANRLRITATRLLGAGQVKEAEPLIRQYLEFKLLQIINKVRIPVPLDFAIKDTVKMVSNSLDAISNAIKLHEKAGTLVLDATQMKNIDTIHVPALVGNWVSHYETASSSSIAPPVLMGVLQTIDDFGECFKFDHVSNGSVERRWYSSLASKI